MQTSANSKITDLGKLKIIGENAFFGLILK